MKSLNALIKRNCLVFFRDKGAVFFSLMSMFVVLGLMVIFLGDMNVKSLTKALSEFGVQRDVIQDETNIKVFVKMWTIAGILVTNAVTVTLAVISIMITDMEKQRLASFYTAPIRKSKTAIAYILSAVIIGTLLCGITFAAAMLYMGTQGGTMLSLNDTLLVLGNIVLNAVVFAMLMYFIATLVKTASAWSGLGTIVGTLVGFAGAIYLPMGSLPTQVGNVLKCTPILHCTAIMREILCKSSMAKAFEGLPKEAVSKIREAMGVDLIVGEKLLPQWMSYVFVLLFGLAVLVLILLRARKHKGYDR